MQTNIHSNKWWGLYKEVRAGTIFTNNTDTAHMFLVRLYSLLVEVRYSESYTVLLHSGNTLHVLMMSLSCYEKHACPYNFISAASSLVLLLCVSTEPTGYWDVDSVSNATPHTAAEMGHKCVLICFVGFIRCFEVNDINSVLTNNSK